MKRSWDGLRSVVEQRVRLSMDYKSTTPQQRQKHRQVLILALRAMTTRETAVQKYLDSTLEPELSTVVYLLNGGTTPPKATRTTHDAHRIIEAMDSTQFAE